MRPSPNKIQTVTSIGAGPIGGGWAAFFLSRGYQVRAYLHSKDEEPIFRACSQIWGVHIVLPVLNVEYVPKIERLFL